MPIVYPTGLGGKKKNPSGNKRKVGGYMKKPRVGAAMRGTVKKTPRRKK
jgi:hypothetical protein